MTAKRQSYPAYDADCRRCTRLAGHLAAIRRTYPDYFAKPVAGFGDPRARLLIVGLAPGLHGANRTGRPFTGDFAGVLLYETLHRFGFASAPASVHVRDGLRLIDCRLTNAVKCLPPQNKPTGTEVKGCNPYLAVELGQLGAGAAILALGRIAHGAVLAALNIRPVACAFAHGARHRLDNGLTLFDSYHCSRYNTQTRRLTAAMFESVFRAIAAHLIRTQP